MGDRTGAGERDRTVVVSLGSFCSTIELHPHVKCDITQHGKSLEVISVFINGAQRNFEHAISVSTLIQEMDLGGKRIALERNGNIVPRSQFDQQMLADGDRLEIVVAVGGG